MIHPTQQLSGSALRISIHPSPRQGRGGTIECVAIMNLTKDQPEVGRERGRRFVASRNRSVELPYANIYEAMQTAEQAYLAHELPYEPGLSNIDAYPPERFAWVFDEAAETRDCVQVQDLQTGRLVVWPWY
jgi:hypothetical protein